MAVDERGAGDAQPADDALELVAAALERADKAAQACASVVEKQSHAGLQAIRKISCSAPCLSPYQVDCRYMLCCAGCGEAVAKRAQAPQLSRAAQSAPALASGSCALCIGASLKQFGNCRVEL